MKKLFTILFCFTAAAFLPACGTITETSPSPMPDAIVFEPGEIYDRDTGNFVIGYEYGTDLDVITGNSESDEQKEGVTIIEMPGEYLLEGHRATKSYHFQDGKLDRVKLLFTVFDGPFEEAFEDILSKLEEALDGVLYSVQRSFAKTASRNSSQSTPFPGFYAIWSSENTERQTFLWLRALNESKNKGGQYISILIGLPETG